VLTPIIKIRPLPSAAAHIPVLRILSLGQSMARGRNCNKHGVILTVHPERFLMILKGNERTPPKI
jgi:hypothetical protein